MSYFRHFLGLFRRKTVIVPLCLTMPIFLFYIGFVNHTEPTEIGIARNQVSGQMWIQEEGGIYITPPWVFVVVVDTRPVRVSVTSSGRGYSAKLVQFDKREWKEFVEVEGWRYYWWSNRLSFNFGYDQEYRGIKDLMRGYAYGAKRYPFIVVLQEYQAK